MTSPLIPETIVKTLPLPLDGDLVIDFRNRDPDNPAAYLDFPAGVVGKFTIYADLKTTGATRVVVTATPSGSHCIVKIDATVLNTIKNETQWGFRLVYPDTDLVNGYDKVVVNGYVVRSDGKKAA